MSLGIPKLQRILALLLFAVIVAPGRAQTTAPAVPVYDVITIKPNKTGSGSVSISVNNGNYSATNVPLKVLLQNAYDIKQDLISGVPGSLESIRFDVEAKVVEPDLPALERLISDQQRAMLLPLLIERFQLKTHIETKTLPVYEMVLLPGGPKFGRTPGVTKPGNGSMSVHNDRLLTAHDLPMAALARTLADQVHRTVLDKTGLPGNYDLSLKWTPDGAADSEPDPAPGLFTAVQEQLGLKLQPAKGPVETLVVDHVEMPSDN